jgi:hypothetical protein
LTDDDWERPIGPCCFCGATIPVEEGPITVTFETDDKFQVFYAHMACVKAHVREGNGIELNLR